MTYDKIHVGTYSVSNGRLPVRLVFVFWQFGHTLQQLLTTVPYSEVAGQRYVEWDSQHTCAHVLSMLLLHRWTLASLGRHHLTDESIPDSLVNDVLTGWVVWCNSFVVECVFMAWHGSCSFIPCIHSLTHSLIHSFIHGRLGWSVLSLCMSVSMFVIVDSRHMSSYDIMRQLYYSMYDLEAFLTWVELHWLCLLCATDTVFVYWWQQGTGWSCCAGARCCTDDVRGPAEAAVPVPAAVLMTADVWIWICSSL